MVQSNTKCDYFIQRIRNYYISLLTQIKIDQVQSMAPLQLKGLNADNTELNNHPIQSTPSK